jgi:hypothetical protein
MIAWWIWVIISVAVFVAVGPLLALLSTAALPMRTHFSMGDIWAHYARLSGDIRLNRAVQDAIRRGEMVFNIPAKMVQGEKECVEVRISRSAAFHEELLSGLRGSGEPQIVEIDTSLYMEVKLTGPTFEVISNSPAEQLIIPTPACWEFDVLPHRAGRRQITLTVGMRIEAEGIVKGHRSVSVQGKRVKVKMNIGYATRRFVVGNWQFLITIALALAAAVAAWLVVPF